MLKKKKIYIGALTDKLYAFKNRCWELILTNTLDVYDSLGSNIKVYTYGSEVKRILPLKNDFVNEEWISNKTRYFFDGLTKWRLNIPLMKKKNIMVYVSWMQGFYYFLLKLWFFSFFLRSKNLYFFNSMYSDYELVVTSKILMKKLGFSFFKKTNNININDYYLYYLNPNFNKDIENKNIFLFVGYNLRLEAPILNIKLRKKAIKEKVFYFTIGSNFNDNLNSKNLGLNIFNLVKYLKGKFKICSLILKKIKDFNNQSMFFIGNNVINRIDHQNIYNLILNYNNVFYISFNYNLLKKKYISEFFFNFFNKNLSFFFLKKDLNRNINILYMNLTSILFEELNLYKTSVKGKLLKDDLFYLLGSDLLNLYKSKFTVFQGHHINLDYLHVNLIFPSITFLEKSGEYLNIEGNSLPTNFILYPPFYCRNDWSILNALYIYIINFVYNIYNFNLKKINFLNVNRFYVSLNNFQKILFFLKRLSVNFYFKEITKYKTYFYNIMGNVNNIFLIIQKIYNTIINNKYYNPYVLDLISQNSTILKKCSIFFNYSIRNYQNINKNV